MPSLPPSRKRAHSCKTHKPHRPLTPDINILRETVLRRRGVVLAQPDQRLRIGIILGPGVGRRGQAGGRIGGERGPRAADVVAEGDLRVGRGLAAHVAAGAEERGDVAGVPGLGGVGGGEVQVREGAGVPVAPDGDAGGDAVGRRVGRRAHEHGQVDRVPDVLRVGLAGAGGDEDQQRGLLVRVADERGQLGPVAGGGARGVGRAPVDELAVVRRAEVAEQRRQALLRVGGLLEGLEGGARRAHAGQDGLRGRGGRVAAADGGGDGVPGCERG